MWRYNVKELKVSPNFTIEDIHKIRTNHYELTKNMSFKELKGFLRKFSDAFDKNIEKIRVSGKI
jgi:hypothetical protein